MVNYIWVNCLSVTYSLSNCCCMHAMYFLGLWGESTFLVYVTSISSKRSSFSSSSTGTIAVNFCKRGTEYRLLPETPCLVPRG